MSFRRYSPFKIGDNSFTRNTKNSRGRDKNHDTIVTCCSCCGLIGNKFGRKPFSKKYRIHKKNIEDYRKAFPFNNVTFGASCDGCRYTVEDFEGVVNTFSTNCSSSISGRGNNNTFKRNTTINRNTTKEGSKNFKKRKVIDDTDTEYEDDNKNDNAMIMISSSQEQEFESQSSQLIQSSQASQSGSELNTTTNETVTKQDKKRIKYAVKACAFNKRLDSPDVTPQTISPKLTTQKKKYSKKASKEKKDKQQLTGKRAIKAKDKSSPHKEIDKFTADKEKFELNVKIRIFIDNVFFKEEDCSLFLSKKDQENIFYIKRTIEKNMKLKFEKNLKVCMISKILVRKLVNTIEFYWEINDYFSREIQKGDCIICHFSNL
ncbi:hypothetical protein ABK040_002463 [Willaertia magna]